MTSPLVSRDAKRSAWADSGSSRGIETRAFFRLASRVALGALATPRKPLEIRDAHAWPCLRFGDGHAHASVEHGTRERETNLKNALNTSWPPTVRFTITQFEVFGRFPRNSIRGPTAPPGRGQAKAESSAVACRLPRREPTFPAALPVPSGANGMSSHTEPGESASAMDLPGREDPAGRHTSWHDES